MWHRAMGWDKIDKSASLEIMQVQKLGFDSTEV